MENMNIVMIICLYDLNEIQGIKLHTQVTTSAASWNNFGVFFC